MNTTTFLNSFPDARCILSDFTDKLARTREIIGLANRKKTELEILARIYETAVHELQGIAMDEDEEDIPPFDPDTSTQETPLPDDPAEEIGDLPEPVQDITVTPSEPAPSEEDSWPDFPDDDWK